MSYGRLSSWVTEDSNLGRPGKSRMLSPPSSQPLCRHGWSRTIVFRVSDGCSPVDFARSSWTRSDSNRRSLVASQALFPIELQAHRRDGGNRTPTLRIPNPVRFRYATSRSSGRRESNPRLHRGTVTCCAAAPRPQVESSLLAKRASSNGTTRTTRSRDLRSARMSGRQPFQ